MFNKNTFTVAQNKLKFATSQVTADSCQVYSLHQSLIFKQLDLISSATNTDLFTPLAQMDNIFPAAFLI